MKTEFFESKWGEDSTLNSVNHKLYARQFRSNLEGLFLCLNVEIDYVFHLISFDNGLNYDNQNSFRGFKTNWVDILSTSDINIDIDLIAKCFDEDEFEGHYLANNEIMPAEKTMQRMLSLLCDAKDELLFYSGIVLTPPGSSASAIVYNKSMCHNYIILITTNSNEIHKYSPFRKRPLSLLDTSIYLLHDHFKKIYPDFSERATVLTINDCFSRFMRIIQVALGIVSWDDLDYYIEEIAALAYESEEACGSMLLCHNDVAVNLLKSMDVVFEEPYELEKAKMIRKLLRIATEDLVLVGNGHRIIGMIDVKRMNEINSDKAFLIRFRRARVWEVVSLFNSERHCLCLVKYGKPSYPALKINKKSIKNKFKQTFDLEDDKCSSILEIIELASSQKHGTMVVFMPNAMAEAKRLCKTSVLVKPINLVNKIESTNKFIKYITSIDGAILCDLDGVCYSIGTILDGKAGAEDECNSRGARHNSAHRYLNGLNPEQSCIIIIVSEDGDITPICKQAH